MLAGLQLRGDSGPSGICRSECIELYPVQISEEILIVFKVSNVRTFEIPEKSLDIIEPGIEIIEKLESS